MLNIPQEKLTAIKNFAHQYIFKLLCQQDIPFILAHLDPQLIGIGAAGHNYYDTHEAACEFIISLKGQFPPGSLSDEKWNVVSLAPDLYLVQGHYCLTSDEGQQSPFRAHRSSSVIWAMISTMFTFIFPTLIRLRRTQRTFLSL